MQMISRGAFANVYSHTLWSNATQTSWKSPSKIYSRTPSRRRCKAIVASSNSRFTVTPPAHPTYDLRNVIKLALAEDAGDKGDISSLATIPVEEETEAHFLAKEDGIVAGVAMASMVFEEVDPQLKVIWTKQDGDFVHKGLQFGSVYGNARSILLAERVALNFMQRMSGIASVTKKMADAAKPARILETRKTAPGLRVVDKWAVLIGGGENHRMGLFDMVMLKDNHISVAGGISNAVASVGKYLKENNLDMDVEVETRTLEEVKEVLSYCGHSESVVTRIMLDNMIVPTSDGDVDVSILKEAVDLIKGRFETEASGNVTMQNVQKIAATGVTFISSGALTHSIKALDVSLKVDMKLPLAVGRRAHLP
eukprot:TRINITY_DN1276_c0_g1_i2.p1 TRINITY_DN1276_c0_g1~~TRINITY_DN1276_c0_g1_i2.p1  ORF type:complete len:367 (+),score=87.07 TRINITY_DN1276_c0_g1_i2:343-1443(+)